MQRPQLGLDRRHVLENVERLVHRHLQNIGDRVAAELDLLHLARVTGAVTHLAWDVDVRQELHLDLDDAVALASLTPSPLHVEAEASRLVAAHLRLGHAREEVTDVREHPGVRRWVAARRPADG